MRGIILRPDIFAAHLPCQVYHRQVPGLQASRRVHWVSARTITTKSDIPIGVDPIQNPKGRTKWKTAPLSDRSSIFDPRLISQQSWNAPSILEGSSEVSRGGDNEPGEKDNQPGENEAARERAFYRIIRDGQPDRVMNAMLDPQYREVIAWLPSSVFVEALRILSPAYFIEPYRSIYRHLHMGTVAAKRMKPLEEIFDEFVYNLAAIIRIRHEAEQALGLAEYKHLLDCARAMGDVELAEATWTDMKDEEIEPDVECYNHYMEAKIWDHAYIGFEKYRLRITPFYYRRRRSYFPTPGWQGFGTGRRSVRLMVLRIFQEMTEREVPPDETTFVNIFLACCRVGFNKQAEAILKSVWNIDCDLLRDENEPEKIPAPAVFDRSSPLHPSERLLFAVAHGFGIINDLQTALRVLDYVSRSYAIPVPENVWYELFERSFVLSRKPYGNSVGDYRGRVSYDFLTTLFDVMTSAPYHVRPSTWVYWKLAKTSWCRSRRREFRAHINDAYDRFMEVRQQSRQARSVVAEYLTTAAQTEPEGRDLILQSSELAEAVHAYAIQRLVTAQLELTMERLVRLYLIHRRWTGRDNPEWKWQLLPQMLEEWADFLPTSFFYSAGTGVVSFQGKTRWGECKIRPHNKVPIRRVAHSERPDIWEEAEEVEDDYFWKTFREGEGRVLNFDVGPLKQLVWESEQYVFPDELDDELELIDDEDTDNSDLLGWLDRIRNTASGLTLPEAAEPQHDTEEGSKTPSPSIPWLSLPWMRDVWAKTVL
ncbi:hypothetical protein AOR_1_1278094 [Paecilomyces variotii No. 5]|uniref:Mitochondrial ATPase expression-domain-containing protein n=1 Tax=Byssochlamys spectabilis (strain No. 5 / NBRC 109023) TaxID=1356009 RepID=V5G5D5_BYSSN|nr:hypothetical protein AOR_1_1278094 [Paecilomyces variotii No. 5]